MYGVTKTAFLGLIKALAAEMGPDTRVNAVPPGVVPTHFASFITRNSEVVCLFVCYGNCLVFVIK
ncbi:hypothetical protein Bca4012_055854 [Brassica carinata]